MAHRRMFSLSVVDTDRFLEMPSSTQALYFHLGMRADDDGFVAAPKSIAAICGCSVDDIRLLAMKGFVQAYRRTGFVSWQHSGSVEEHLIEYLESKGSYTTSAVNSAVQ